MSTLSQNQDGYGNDFLTLTDDEGNQLELEHLDTLEYEGETYMAFIPAEMSLSDEYELMILRVEPDEQTGEEILPPWKMRSCWKRCLRSSPSAWRIITKNKRKKKPGKRDIDLFLSIS